MSINLEKETKKISGKYIYINDAKKDYIQDISIDTNIKQDSREGYNDFDTKNFKFYVGTQEVNDLTCERQNDGSFIINGTTPTGGSDIRFTSDTPIITLKAGTHTFYFTDQAIGNMFNCEVNISSLGNGTYTLIKRLSEAISYKELTLTEDLEIYSINYHLNPSTTYTNFIFKPMIYEGAYDVKKVFEQYGSMPSIEFPSEIKTPVGKQSLVSANKNLLPFNIESQDVNGTTLTINEDKSFTIKGTTIGSMSSKNFEIGRIPLKAILDIPVTLSRGFINRDNNIGAFVSKIVDSNGNTILTNALNLDANNWTQYSTKTFTSSEWGSYDDLDLVVILFFPSLDGVEIDLEGYAQLEYGTVATEYVEHQSQVQNLDLTSELLGTIVDLTEEQATELGLDGEGSYFKDRYYKYVFTGNEYFSNQYGTNLFDSQGLLNKQPFKIEEKAYCNYFKYNSIQNGINANTVNGEFALQHNDYNKFNVFFKCTDYDNVDDFKAKLKELYNSGTPVKIVYKLATPTYTKLTDEQQAQWNKIKKMHTYEGVTNIYTINDNGISPVLNLEYTTKYAKEYDFYIDENARFIVPEYGINYQVSIPESDLSDMPEASESAVKIAGKDGDVVLNTTYEPKDFNIVAYTDDNLEPKDKEAEKTKLVNFLHSIKNRTKNFGLLYREKFYPVKYNDKLTPTIYPKSIRFEIPIKSSKSLGYALEKKMIFGNGKEISNTIEETGCKIIIDGPIYGTNDSPMVITLNNYQMAYYNTVLVGNRLEIDTNNSTIKHISSNGEVTNVAAYYNHEYPKIKYGENEIKILSKIDSETQVYTEWYDLKI